MQLWVYSAYHHTAYYTASPALWPLTAIILDTVNILLVLEGFSLNHCLGLTAAP